MKILLYAGLLIIAAQSLCSQVRILTDKGYSEGYIVNKTDSTYTIRDTSNIEIIFYASEIRDSWNLKSNVLTNADSLLKVHIYQVDSNSIYYIDDNDYNCIRNLLSIKSYNILDYGKSSYYLFGATFGPSTGFSLQLGYQTDGISSIRAGIGYYDHFHESFGIQLCFGININRNQVFEHNLSINAGIINERKYLIQYHRTDTYREARPFVSLSYNINFYGIFFEFGYPYNLEVENSYYFQVGYVHRFTD